jgi:hypothetical protein
MHAASNASLATARCAHARTGIRFRCRAIGACATKLVTRSLRANGSRDSRTRTVPAPSERFNDSGYVNKDAHSYLQLRRIDDFVERMKSCRVSYVFARTHVLNDRSAMTGCLDAYCRYFTDIRIFLHL